jgi:hypothetical protein
MFERGDIPLNLVLNRSYASWVPKAQLNLFYMSSDEKERVLSAPNIRSESSFTLFVQLSFITVLFPT